MSARSTRMVITAALIGAALSGAGLCGAALAAEEPHGASESRARREPARPPAPVHQAVPARPAYRSNAPGPAHYDGRGQVLDARYNHGRYYAPLGTVAHTLPGDYRAYYHHGAPYYFSGGVWYAPRGAGFVVVRPPVGLSIAVLPPYYTTVWVGGVPYYYADNVYYTWAPDQSAYVVAPPPDDAAPPPDGGAVDPNAHDAPPAPAPSDFIIYPKQGQSKDQQAADEYECHSWAKGQTGFDPTQPDGGVAPNDADRSHANYDRAMAACLQGRGYQVN